MHSICIKCNLTNENSSMLWHKRLGHISKQRIERLISHEIFDSLDMSDFDVCINVSTGRQLTKGIKV